MRSDDPKDSADPTPPREVTQVLEAWRAGDDRALERLLPMVYEELRTIAKRQLDRERRGHTLQPTALVNEAYLRLKDLRAIQWHDRSHFFAFSSRIMRRVLVDSARRRKAGKRLGSGEAVALDEALDEAAEPALSADALIDLDRALEGLAGQNPGLAQIVEMRFFGGLGVDEIAGVLGCSGRTVKRNWSFARAWLLRELRRSAG